MGQEQLMKSVGVSDRKYFRLAYLQPTLEARLAEMTLPDKPNSSRQQYRLTKLGKSLKHEA